MNKIIFAALLVLLSGSPQLAQAADWSITAFNSDITVETNADITVTETIQVNFSGVHHGIRRNLPQRATMNDRVVRLRIEDVAAKRNGTSEPFTVETRGDERIITVRDGDVERRGVQTYEISYRVKAAVNFFTDFDELNWNVTGTAWDVPLTSVTATIHLPTDEATPTTLCYTGPTVGSKQQACSGIASAGTATYTASEPMTIISHWKKGIVTQPDTYEGDREVRVTKLDQLLLNRTIGWLALIIFPVLAVVVMLLQWMKHGRDPEGKKTIVPLYEPPSDLRPAELPALLSNGMRSAGIGTTIVDLAVRGYLRIEQTTEQKVFGEKKEYTFVRLKEKDETLRKYEKAIFQALFASKTTDRVSLSDLKKRRTAVATAFQTAQGGILKELVQRQYFPNNPHTMMMVYIGVGAVLIAPIFFAGQLSVATSWTALMILIGLLVSGLIVLAFAFVMPRRTEKGVEAVREIRGLKLFITTAEKYRLQWQEKEHIFELLLPYAMALGVAEKWAKTFDGIAMQDSTWYVGGDAMHSIALYSSLQSFERSFAATTTISSDGGSSMGGFGGGGGGGGGGAV